MYHFLQMPLWYKMGISGTWWQGRIMGYGGPRAPASLEAPPCWTDTRTPRSPGCKSIIVAIGISADIAYHIGITA